MAKFKCENCPVNFDCEIKKSTYAAASKFANDCKWAPLSDNKIKVFKVLK